MLYGLDPTTGKKIRAKPGKKAICPLCGEELIPKCGQIRIWHWAHKKKSNCDTWAEPESDWHLFWKSLAPQDWCEKVIKKGNEVHRADILTEEGKVIELQHSPISPEEIQKRENFYENMMWIFDCRNKEYKKINSHYGIFKMKYFKQSLNYCNKEVVIDYGVRGIHILQSKFYNNGTYRAVQKSPFQFIRDVLGYEIPEKIKSDSKLHPLYNYVRVYYSKLHSKYQSIDDIPSSENIQYYGVKISCSNGDIKIEDMLVGIIFLLEKIIDLGIKLPDEVYFDKRNVDVIYSTSRISWMDKEIIKYIHIFNWKINVK